MARRGSSNFEVFSGVKRTFWSLKLSTLKTLVKPIQPQIKNIYELKMNLVLVLWLYNDGWIHCGRNFDEVLCVASFFRDFTTSQDQKMPTIQYHHWLFMPSCLKVFWQVIGTQDPRLAHFSLDRTEVCHISASTARLGQLTRYPDRSLVSISSHLSTSSRGE